MIIALRVKIIGVKNTAEKMKKILKKWKNIIIFLFSYKMITTTNYNTQKISLDSLQNKKSREGIEYQNIPILYDGKRAIVHLCGRFNLEEDVSFDGSPITLTLSVWKLMMITENYLRISRKNFKSLTGDGELKLIKYGRVYLKIYVNDKGEMAPKFWEVLLRRWERSTKKQFGTKNLYLENILKVK